MRKDSSLFLLGLCRKSGSLKSGSQAVLMAIRSGKAFLVLIASDCSANTKKQITDKSNFYQVPCLVVPYTRKQLGDAAGQSPRSCMAITEKGLAVDFQKAINSHTNEVENID